MAKFKEEEIQKMMKNLDLSREEAIQLLQDDEDDISVELTAEQKKVAKQMSQGDRIKEKVPRKRERKVDEVKKMLLEGLGNKITELEGQIIEVKNEAEISFWFNGTNYSLKLIKHREKKE